MSLAAIASASAAEADQFTRRFEPPLADSSAEINRRLNELLSDAVGRANEFERGWRGSADPGKREWRLYKEMRKVFSNHSKSEFVRELVDNDEADDGIARRRIPKADSIYAGWCHRDGAIIGNRFAHQSRIAFSPMVRVGEVTVGIDKIEHFFGSGWWSFNAKYNRGLSDSRVIRLSCLKEKMILGGNRFATGVFSYADLVADFNGMRFWNDVLQKHDDVLGKHENAGPYVIRVGDVWEVNPEKPIDLRHYIDWGMDEGINCSRYASWGGARKVRRALEELSAGDPDHDFHFMMDPEKLEQMRVKYGKYSRWLFNTGGITRRGLVFER